MSNYNYRKQLYIHIIVEIVIHTIPLVTTLRRRQATVEPSNWAIQQRKPVKIVICPPTANPNVTAGFKWPPEILAAIETPTNRANACATATANKPAGSSAASDVTLSEKKNEKS